jgi:hypothetical protein
MENFLGVGIWDLYGDGDYFLNYCSCGKNKTDNVSRPVYSYNLITPSSDSPFKKDGRNVTVS